MNGLRTNQFKTRRGQSQLAVINYLREHPDSTAQQVGDALYDRVSQKAMNGAELKEITGDPKIVRRSWAVNIIHSLNKKGLVKGRKKPMGKVIYWWQTVFWSVVDGEQEE